MSRPVLALLATCGLALAGLTATADGRPRTAADMPGPALHVRPGSATTYNHSGARVLTRLHANSQTFTDPTGDSGNAPDITMIAVSNDDAGTITFTITFSNRPTLGSQDLISGYFNTDQNTSTGGPCCGWEYVLAANSAGLVVKQWNGSSYQPVAKPTASSSRGTNTLTISINRSDLGGTASFDFALDTGDTNNPFVERAPDEPGDTYSYQVAVGNPTTTTAPSPPPPPPSPAPKPQFVVAPVGMPHAGKHFVVRARVVVGAVSARPASLACTARVGATPVKTSVVTPPGPYTGCALTVPARTAGKTLVVVLKVHFQATAATRTLSLKIR